MGKSNKGRITRGRDLDKWRNNRAAAPEGCIRIIGGQYRGQTLLYSGDRVTRPMKDNVREALFNLVGGYLGGTIVFDLFAGTGAVGLEALSRQAAHAVLVERHVPTSKIIRQNTESLAVTGQSTICCSDTFFWTRQFEKEMQQKKISCLPLEFDVLSQHPWSVFCCPPYDLFLDSEEKLTRLIATFAQLCPANSLIVTEFDSRFDADKLPDSQLWKTREYSPAILSVRRIPENQDLDDSASEGNPVIESGQVNPAHQ
ncbi:MAG: RsmD family RNA methyltransferase [Planctomycetota bacterium]|nr:RsmD family RNA methyltransferase [Planctomycetota bacterium]